MPTSENLKEASFPFQSVIFLNGDLPFLKKAMEQFCLLFLRFGVFA